MKILLVGSNMAVMTDDMKGMVKKDITFQSTPPRLLHADGSTIDVLCVREYSDLERVRGMRFDVILEHRCLDTRIPGLFGIMHELQARVIR